jgi:hypothetical protein
VRSTCRPDTGPVNRKKPAFRRDVQQINDSQYDSLLFRSVRCEGIGKAGAGSPVRWECRWSNCVGALPGLAGKPQGITRFFDFRRSQPIFALREDIGAVHKSQRQNDDLCEFLIVIPSYAPFWMEYPCENPDNLDGSVSSINFQLAKSEHIEFISRSCDAPRT